MYAYNRKALQKVGAACAKDAADADSTMDESGYASFKAMHNSSVEAPPFLFERDCETENCRNASNTALASGSNARALQHKLCFNSTQFQSPGSIAALESEDELQAPTAAATATGAIKRRKPQQQHAPMTHHSSPKKSKKKLFPMQSEDRSDCRTRFYNGLERLDMIGMLGNTLPALECILAHVNSRTLDIMTQVSERWAQAVHKIKRAEQRLLNYRFKMNRSKENLHTVKLGRRLSKSTANSSHIVPLQTSNAIHQPNTRQDSMSMSMLDDTSQLVEQMQCIKCPRCGKSSKVFYSRAGDRTPQMTRLPPAVAALSQTLPHTATYSSGRECGKPSTLTRFYSLDEMKSSPQLLQQESCSSPYSFAECTSLPCRFRFCVHCYCQPHPGEKCLVTEMGTPSKVMMPVERVTPPKRTQKFDSKLTRKRSLKRLNF
ncbi:hypothetical protein KR222_002118 [Zaprionus bogoriensis]|nr:hypothetical protein KR222_002118 [Zaprionus bogoriensis]